jgi:AcrR family transcriptional regulator
MAGQRGPYAKTPEVRARIIDAASEMFAASGYRGTTMKDIAGACGLTAKGVSHHFSSKDELLMAVLAARDSRGRKVADKASDASVSFEVLFESLATTRHEPRLVELYAVLSAEAISPDHPAHDYHQQRYGHVRDEFEYLIDKVVGGREGSTEPSARDLASLLIAVIDGLQLQWLYDADAIDLEQLVRTFVARVLSSDQLPTAAG